MLGASVTGLLAATVLATVYDHVVLVERDERVGDGEPRRGVPQARHAHVLLPRGGHLFSRDPMSVDTPAHAQSRPFLEAHVLRRVRALPNLTVLDGHDVVGIRADASGRRVAGALVAPRDGSSGERCLPADLVVAAPGRISTVPAWLTELGYDVPPEEEVPR